jgi:hypothetical protein
MRVENLLWLSWLYTSFHSSWSWAESGKLSCECEQECECEREWACEWDKNEWYECETETYGLTAKMWDWMCSMDVMYEIEFRLALLVLRSARVIGVEGGCWVCYLTFAISLAETWIQPSCAKTILFNTLSMLSPLPRSEIILSSI